MSARVLTMRLHQLAARRLDEKLMPTSVSPWAKDRVESLSYAIERLVDTAKLKPARVMAARWKEMVATCERGIAKADLLYLTTKNATVKIAASTDPNERQKIAFKALDTARTIISELETMAAEQSQFSKSELLPILKAHESDPKNTNLIKFYLKQANGPGLLVLMDLKDIAKLASQPQSQVDYFDYVETVMREWRLGVGATLLDIFSVTARLLPYFSSMADELEGPIRNAIKQGTAFSAALPPMKAREKPEPSQFSTGRRALAWAQKGLKPTPFRLLAPPTQKVVRQCKELAASMAETLKKWRALDAVVGEMAEEDSRDYRARMDAELASGKKYSDVHLNYRERGHDDYVKVADLRQEVLRLIFKNATDLASVAEPFRSIEGARGEWDDPLGALRDTLHTFARMATASAVEWQARVPDILYSMDDRAASGFHDAVNKASWSMGDLWRGTPQWTGFAEMADAVDVCAQLVPYLHSAAAVKVDTNPVDRFVGLGNVGPWDLSLHIPAGFLKKYDIKVAPDEEGAANTVKRIATSALSLYRRLGVKDRALAGPIIVKWRDPDEPEDKDGSAGYYAHNDGRIVIYLDGLIGISGPGETPDVNLADATWTFIHEVAHRIYYKGLTTEARNYWHTIIQKMGDPLPEMTKRVVVAHAAFAFDPNAKSTDSPIGGKFVQTGTGTLLVDIPGFADINVTGTLRGATPKEKALAETIWWWYSKRWPHDKFIDWLNAKRYTKELPTEYANVTPIEAWPEAVANTVLRRPRMKEGRDTTPFVRALIHRLLGQVREDVNEATALRKPPAKKRKKKVPKPVLDKLLQGQYVEQVATVGPVRVAVVMPDERMFDIKPGLRPARRIDVGFAVNTVGMQAYPADLVSDVVDKVKQAVNIMRRGGIPERALATRVVFDFTRRIDHYAEADYTYPLDVIVAKVQADVSTLIHELAHRVWFKALGEQGRKSWLAFLDSISEPLPEKIQTVAFAMAMREEWDELQDAAEDDEDFEEMWAATMLRLEGFMNNRPHLYAGQRIEEYQPSNAFRGASKETIDIADTLWSSFQREHGTSPRAFAEWLESKTYSTKLPSAYANTDEHEAWAEAVMDTLFSRWNNLPPATQAVVRVQVMRALKGGVREGIDEVTFTSSVPVKWYDGTAKFTLDDTDYRVRLFGQGSMREVIFEALTENGWTIGITGTGNPIKVLSSVVYAVTEFVKAHPQVTSLVFTAKGRGRTGTYSKMAKLLARQFKWPMKETVDGDAGVFAMGKTEKDAIDAMKIKSRTSGGLWAKAVERHADKRVAAINRDIERMRASSVAYAAAHPESRQVNMPLSALSESRASLIECLRAAGLDEAAFSETSVAVSLRLPSSIARQFPDRGDHDPTPPHITVLVIGDAPVEKWKQVQAVVAQVAAATRPFQASVGDYGEFKPKPDFIVSHMQVESAGLRALYQRLLVALRESGVSFDLKWPTFKPHITLSYGAEPWTGRRPSGSWTVDEVEVWRGTKSKIKFPLGEPARMPLAASREHALSAPLFESMDSPYPWTVDRSRLSWLAAFDTPAGTYSVKMEADGSAPDLWYVDFKLHQPTGRGDSRGDFKVTGTGNAGRVFATVLDIMKKWVAEVKPESFRFTAKEPSRQRLYRTLAVKFFEKWGYTWKWPHVGEVFRFQRVAESLEERGSSPQMTKWNEKHKLPTLWSALRNTLVLDLLPRLYEMNKKWKAVDAMAAGGDTPRYRAALKKVLDATADPTLELWMSETPSKLLASVRATASEARREDALTTTQVQAAYDKTNEFASTVANNGLMPTYPPAHFVKPIREMIAKGWATFFREYGNQGHSLTFMQMFFGDKNLAAIDTAIGKFINFLHDLADAIEQGRERREAAAALNQVGKVGTWRLMVMGDFPAATVEKFERAAAEGWKRLKALGVADRYLSGPVLLRDHRPERYGAGGYFAAGGGSSSIGSNVAAVEVTPESDISYQRMLEVIIHEVGHRLYYQGLSNTGRKVWDAFIDSQGDPWPKGKLIAMLSTVPALRPAVKSIFGLDDDEVERAAGNVRGEDATIASLFWWRWSYNPGGTPEQFIKDYMLTKRYTHALPSNYANTSAIEAWPEVTVDLALKRTKLGGAGDTGDIILGAFHAALGTLKESIDEGPRNDDPFASLNALAKFNDGLWKSEKQGKFLTDVIRREKYLTAVPELRQAAKAQGVDLDTTLVAGRTSLIGGFGTRTAEKRRYFFQGFAIDGFGVLMRWSAKAKAGVRFDPGEEQPREEGQPDWSTLQVAWKRQAPSGPIFVEPTGKAEAAELAKAIEANKPMMDKIASIPGWESNSFLRDMHKKLALGGDLSIGMKGALDRIFAEHGIDRTTGDDADSWERGWKHVYNRITLGMIAKAKQEAETTIRDKALTHLDADKAFSTLRAELIRVNKEVIKARENYESPWYGGMNLVHHFLVEALEPLGWKRGGWRRYFVGSKRADQNPGVVGLLADAKFAIQMARAGKNIDKASLHAIQDVMRLAEKMGLRESVAEATVGKFCPMPIYGGLPSAGGFSAATEYEIGAQRATEAAHCLLGSIERAGRQTIQVEAGHIKEEMGIIEFVSREYGKSLYSQRLIDGFYEGDPRRAALPAKSVESIRRAAPRLKAEAKKLLAEADGWFPNDPVRTKAIRWCYYYVIALCDAMVESVADFPKRMGNAYASLDVRTHVRALRGAVDDLLRQRDESVRGHDQPRTIMVPLERLMPSR